MLAETDNAPCESAFHKLLEEQRKENDEEHDKDGEYATLDPVANGDQVHASILNNIGADVYRRRHGSNKEHG
jgi:hypothetical protein